MREIGPLASLHVTRRPFYEIVHVCNAGFSCLVRFTNELSPRSGLGSFISSPRGSSVLSSLFTLSLFLPFARIGRACRQQRFFPSPRDSTSLSASFAPFFFHFQRKDIVHPFHTTGPGRATPPPSTSTDYFYELTRIH